MKKIPCKNCISYPICRNKYIKTYIYTASNTFGRTVIGHEVRLNRMKQDCYLISKWSKQSGAYYYDIYLKFKKFLKIKNDGGPLDIII